MFVSCGGSTAQSLWWLRLKRILQRPNASVHLPSWPCLVLTWYSHLASTIPHAAEMNCPGEIMDGQCMKVYTSPNASLYPAAARFCEQQGGVLAAPRSWEQHVGIVQSMAEKGCLSAWIGLETLPSNQRTDIRRLTGSRDKFSIWYSKSPTVGYGVYMAPVGWILAPPQQEIPCMVCQFRLADSKLSSLDFLLASTPFASSRAFSNGRDSMLQPRHALTCFRQADKFGPDISFLTTQSFIAVIR